MAYTTNDLRKGLKIEIDGEPYLIVECNFYKPSVLNQNIGAVDITRL